MSDLPPLIEALLRPDAYPHPVDGVELVQTHVSYVLLAGDYVYKIKKPVDFGFLNFTTLARRRYYCQQEVVLNRRLCADTYLGVVPVVAKDGRFWIGGEGRPRGRVVEYAVQMRRLPQERMLDRLLPEGQVTSAMMAAVAERLADFHRRAESGPQVARYGSRRMIGFNWRENFEQTVPYIGRTISAEAHRSLQAYVRRFMTTYRRLLDLRVREGRIRDCHGDIRSNSVCFTDGICIYDCIEFNRRFRYSDVTSEVAFLAMDLDYQEYAELARALVESYARAADDPELLLLIDFYRCYRAYVRGKVDGFLIDQAEVPAPEREAAAERARRYFDLALDYASRRWPPMLIVTCGLVGTGKSTLAEALAQRLPVTVLRSDVIRKELAGIAPTEHRQEEFERGIYAPEFTQRTYDEMFGRARRLLSRGRWVVLDATFGDQQQRANAQELAHATSARFLCVECLADEATVRQRLEERESSGLGPSDANWQIYIAQRQTFHPVTELPPQQHLPVEMTGDPLKNARQVSKRLLLP